MPRQYVRLGTFSSEASPHRVCQKLGSRGFLYQMPSTGSYRTDCRADMLHRYPSIQKALISTHNWAVRVEGFENIFSVQGHVFVFRIWWGCIRPSGKTIWRGRIECHRRTASPWAIVLYRWTSQSWSLHPVMEVGPSQIVRCRSQAWNQTGISAYLQRCIAMNRVLFHGGP